MPKQYIFTVISNKQIAPNVCYLSVKPNEKPTYLAGQYFSFKVDQEVLRRSYSVASSPNDETLDFIVELISGGIGSTFIQSLKPGDTYEAFGPLGFFNLEKTGAQLEQTPLIFIGTGTGIVPMRSIIRHLLLEQNSSRKIELYFGLRFDAHAYLFDEFQELAAKFPNFTFTPVISRPSPNWKGEIGHCQDIIMRKPADTSSRIFLCGSNRSVDGISADLIAHGYLKERIHFEKFG